MAVGGVKVVVVAEAGVEEEEEVGVEVVVWMGSRDEMMPDMVAGV